MNPNQAHQGSKTHPGGNLAAVDEPHGGAEPVTQQAGRFLPASRCRHPGDVIRLILSAVVLTGTLAAVAVAHRRLLSPGAAAVTWPGSGPAGRLLTGSAQLAFVVAAAGIAAAALRRRRDHRDRRRLPRRRTHRRRLPHPRRPRRHRSRPRRRPDRHRHRPRTRRTSRPHLPARHLLATRPTRMDLPADPAETRLHMTPGRPETCHHERTHLPG